MSRILICCIPASGHLNPALALGQQLKQAGHDVRVAALPQDKGAADAAGVDTIRLTPASSERYWISRNPKWLRGLHRFPSKPGFAAGLLLSAGVIALLPFLEPAVRAATPLAIVGWVMAAQLSFWAVKVWIGAERVGFMVDRYILTTFLQFSPVHYRLLRQSTEVADFSPDLVIVDSLAYGAAAWCQEEGRLWITVCMFPGSLYEHDDPPFTGWGLRPLPADVAWPRRAWRSTVTWLSNRLTAIMESDMRRTWRRYERDGAMPPVPPTRAMNAVSPRLALCFTHPYLEYGRGDGWPKHVRLVGPALCDGGAHTTPERSEELADLGEKIEAARREGKKIVYLTFGTLWYHRAPRFFAKALAAVAREKSFLVIATTGDEHVLESLRRRAPRALVFRTVPHSWLIPRIDVILHHGGFSTAMEAAMCGKLAVFLPFGVVDNFETAARMEHLGLARWYGRRWHWLLGTRLYGDLAGFVRRELDAWEREDDDHPYRRMLRETGGDRHDLDALRSAGAVAGAAEVERLLRSESTARQAMQRRQTS